MTEHGLFLDVLDDDPVDPLCERVHDLIVDYDYQLEMIIEEAFARRPEQASIIRVFCGKIPPCGQKTHNERLVSEWRLRDGRPVKVLEVH
jgi:hypothetical protein